MRFEQLQFNPRKSQGLWDYKAYTCLQALAEFDNGFAVSVLTADKTGPNKYCQAKEGSYEIAILKDEHLYYGYTDKDREGSDIEDEYDLDQDAFEGVWIYQPKEKVQELLDVVEKFKK